MSTSRTGPPPVAPVTSLHPGPSEDSTALSSVADSTTAETAPRTPLTVFVIGDFGDGSTAERRVADVMNSIASDESVAALVTTGDNLYTDDLEAAWTGPFGWIGDAGIPVYAAWGNHDLQSSSRKSAVTTALAPPGRWYSVAIGQAKLIVLDANDPSNREQLDWLEAELHGKADGPVLVSFHQPAFSCGSHGSTAAVDKYWVPLFARAGVDLVLNGHDHNYQRFEVDGVVYVVTGGGGRGLYRVGHCPAGTPEPIAFDDQHHHFLILDLTPDSISGRVMSDQAETLDSFDTSVDG